MKKYISKFHYLTHETSNFSHLQLAQMACEAGIKWIQYRPIDKPFIEKIKEVNQMAEICDDWGSSLIICQDIELAKHAKDYQGLHIENHSELTIKEAREVIGEDRALGLSCPDIQKMVRLKDSGVDYFSIGPYGYTNTIQSIYPKLGPEGLIKSLETLEEISPGFDVPIIVIGGVYLNDLPFILKTSAFGIGISSAINLSANPKLAMLAFYKEMLASSD